MAMKTRKKSHKDVRFQVGMSFFHTFAEACTQAVRVNIEGWSKSATIDVIVSSADGARWWGGSPAAAEYRDAPDASVFERIVVKADSKGSIR